MKTARNQYTITLPKNSANSTWYIEGLIKRWRILIRPFGASTPVEPERLNSLFLKKNFIALGWKDIGDLSSLPANREAFKTRMAEYYPSKKSGAIPVDAGQLFRFVHEMKVDDFVAYPSKQDRQIHIGQVTGPYQFDAGTETGYPHLRSVKWLKTVPRTHFSQGALYEIGSAMSLFLIKNYSDEYFDAIEGKDQVRPVSASKDQTVAVVADEVEQTTRDFVLKQLAQELKGHPLADFSAHLLEKMGYHTRLSPEGTDGGIDIIAHRDELGFEPPIIKVQVKSTDGSIGAPAVQALYGNIDTNNREYGLFITLGSFSPPARTFARNKSNLRLIDGQAFVDLVLQYYEKFDPRYKGLIPLKRVYIPQSLVDDAD